MTDRARDTSFADGLPPLPRSFYLRGTITVARDLLGRVLCRRLGKTVLAGRIVEVEAYLGARDPAAHTYRGRTSRNEVMYREGGHLYVYFTYGMHFCCNVVTGKEGVGQAVLIRALEPIAGIPAMARNRGLTEKDLHLLASGPARVCQALRIGRAENGTDLTGSRVWVAGLFPSRRGPVGRSARIGITSGREHLWRFFLRQSPCLSRAKPRRSHSPRKKWRAGWSCP